ncbi:MAG TPA: LysR family transcriptional regulator [Gammaproteobacteria bacterium]|nr:LysR family transcriptional regulator [Gammaproteobacteria bacterium]
MSQNNVMLELRHLRSLQAIQQCGSLARAAEQLHLTQSALSHQIKALENYYETSLFLRSTKPLSLTSAGLKLRDLAERILPEIELVDGQLRRHALGTSGRLYISIECHACFEWLIPVLDQYRHRWPDVDIDIRLGLSFEPIAALQKGEVDLVISSDLQTHKDLCFEPLFDYEAQLALAHDHPLTVKDYILPEDLADQTLVTYPVDRKRLDVFSRFLQPANVEPGQVRQAELTAIILLLVSTLKGVAVLPDWVLRESMSHNHLTTRPLGAQGMHGTLHAAVRKVESEAAYIQGFIDLGRMARK